jgi:hypothetical protein
VERLKKDNYKKLKKHAKIYYDRGSVLFRGPFIYEKTIRGPHLLFTIKDSGYLNKVYDFSIAVNKLKNEQLFFIIDNQKHKLNSRKSRKTRKTHKTHKTRRKRRRKTRKSKK